MEIYGLQKLTLLDYPGKVACTIFTGGCNLRCPFCHNASLITGAQGGGTIGEKEVFAFLAKRQGVLDGVCISGGEPLLQGDLTEFLRQVRSLGYLIKLDTNGCYPGRLKELVAQKLVDYVAMDVKSSPERYPQATGTAGFDFSLVSQSIGFLLLGNVDYEFRTTVVGGLHDAEILRKTARAIRGAKRYFLQQYVHAAGVTGDGLFAFSDNDMRMFLDIVSPYVQTAALRGV